MSDLAAEPTPATTPDSWVAQLDQLKARHKHVRPPILVAANILLHDQNIELADAKAQAALHGVRITAASMNAARTLLSRMDAPPAAAPITLTPPPVPRTPRRQRVAQPPLDAEAMVRAFVDRVQTEKNAEVERLRDGIRKAIAALQAAVG